MYENTEGPVASGRGSVFYVMLWAAVLILGAFVCARVTAPTPMAPPTNIAVAATAPPATKSAGNEAISFRVYYFHRTVRCPSCQSIEDLTKSVVEEDFYADLAVNDMLWKTFNLDEPENQHFEDDYQLEAQSVVLSEVRNGKEVYWKNLKKVWDLLGDEASFRDYIRQEVQAFLDGQQEDQR